MSKFARLTVKVPIDDAMQIAQLRGHLREVLEERGIESVDLVAEANGEAPAEMLPDTAPRKGRIYWPAAEVVIAMDRPERAPAKPKPRNGSSARAQT
jgi:hypothetical protein